LLAIRKGAVHIRFNAQLTTAFPKRFGNNRLMHRLIAATAQVIVLVGMVWPVPASAQEVETRRFDGVGSRGIGSDVEFFLVEGTYRHTLEGTSNCIITASVFPGPQQPAAVLSEVINADLAILDDVATDNFPITEQGWVNLQVGTGPECAWEYTVTGVFLPLGDEPKPPGSGLIGWWPVGLVAMGAALLIAGAVRRRPPAQGHEPKVQVAEPPD